MGMSKKSSNKVTMVQYIYVFIFALLNVTFSSLIANAMPTAKRNVPHTKGNHQEELPEDYPYPGPQQEDIEQVKRYLLVQITDEGTPFPPKSGRSRAINYPRGGASIYQGPSKSKPKTRPNYGGNNIYIRAGGK